MLFNSFAFFIFFPVILTLYYAAKDWNRQKQILAQEAAELALSMTDRFNKIVLARMRDDDPIVDVITS